MKTSNSTRASHGKFQKSRLYNLVFVPIALLALYVIVPQLAQFDSAFTAVKSADAVLVMLAGFFVAGAVLSAAAVYVFLAQQSIRYRDSVVVQTAGMFVNRLLPAGIGGMGLSADFLYRHKHSLAHSAAIVALNNTLTFVGHMLLLGLVLAAGLAVVPELAVPAVSPWLVFMLVLLSGLVAALFGARFLRRAQSFLVDFVRALMLYSTQKSRVIIALSFTLCNTAGHAGALFLCMQAFSLDLSVGVAIVALTGGVAVASVTPTPGGLFGSEAGITAVLMSYDISAGTSLAVALSYRLVSYWIPLLPGALAFWYAGHKRLI